MILILSVFIRLNNVNFKKIFILSKKKKKLFYLLINIYIYIYIYMCVYVCVCEFDCFWKFFFLMSEEKYRWLETREDYFLKAVSKIFWLGLGYFGCNWVYERWKPSINLKYDKKKGNSRTKVACMHNYIFTRCFYAHEIIIKNKNYIKF